MKMMELLKSGKQQEVHIEYCVKWNYGPEFDRVSKLIKKKCPKAMIIGNQTPPRSGAFEITINNELVYSKFKTNTFPSEDEILVMVLLRMTKGVKI